MEELFNGIGPKGEFDLSGSKLKIEGTPEEQKLWKDRFRDWRSALLKDQSDRKKKYKVRRDFYEGDQAKYTNIIGLTKKEKQGHADAVLNIAGKMINKIHLAMGNNPPHYIYKPLLKTDTSEQIKTQGVEDFVQRVFWQNKFWLTGYKDGSLNQTLLANFAVMVYPDFEKGRIRLINIEKMENLLVGWRGDNTNEYDYTIYEELRSTYSIEKEFGIKVPPIDTHELSQEATASGHNDPFSTQEGSRDSTVKSSLQPSGENDLPMARVSDMWTDDYNAIFLNGQLVQLVKHNWGMNPVRVGRNIHKPGKVWDMSDIDWLIDPQIEFNEVNNDVRDFIRSGVNQKYRAHNMADFDPEALKAGSGQVIYTEDDETFEPIPINVNTFPADTYAARIEKTMHKLGVPEVTFGSGSSAGVSGRARAVDFQSFAEVIIDKQGSWESVLQDVSELIQVLGNEYFAPESGENFFLGPSGEFEVREISIKWDEVLPTTQSDKQVDIINKKNARIISLRTSLDEMGYDDPDTEIEKMKKEWQDKDLAPILANKGEFLEGIIKAETRAMIEKSDAMQELQQQQIQNQGPQPDQNGNPTAEPPTMMPDQNQERKMPMAQPGSERRYAAPAGMIAMRAQNDAAQR